MARGDAYEQVVAALAAHGRTLNRQRRTSCPAHDGADANPAVDAGRDGVLLTCHSHACSAESIAMALGLPVAALFDDYREGATVAAFRPCTESWAHSPPLGPVVATYAYQGEQGTPLYEVLRYDPKTFRPRRIDGAGHWHWDLNGTRRVLYRLPELLQAKQGGRGVVFVEGERDADNLAVLGIVATTVAGGASAPLPDDIGRVLAGAAVAVLPDNDEPGRAFACRVARAVHKQAASVKIVDLPGLAPKGDASDWIEAGGTREQLNSLIAAAAEYDPTTTVENEGARRKPFRFDSVRLSDVQPEHVTWLWPGRVPWGKLTILEADPGMGKSTGAPTRGLRLDRATHPAWRAVDGTGRRAVHSQLRGRHGGHGRTSASSCWGRLLAYPGAEGSGVPRSGRGVAAVLSERRRGTPLADRRHRRATRRR